ncbi:hypothetical protein [Aestuariibius sp. HNIBRBA575]|uniref:hypothetical protein n=1 Tax=Aestuariibius sp. HNIBRBA575 TaxID=3233343 RepID=UPI0034A24480
MPILIAVLGGLAAVYFFVNRAKNAADLSHDLLGVANDVRLAARRFGFQRRSNTHPADSIEDPKLAIATIAIAFLELDDLPTKEQRGLLDVQLRSTLRVSAQDSSELQILGRWLMNECQGPQPAITRLARVLFKLDGANSFEPLLTILKGITTEDLSGAQREAINDIRRGFKLH